MDEIAHKIRLAIEAGEDEEALGIWTRFVLEGSSDVDKFVEMLTEQPDLHQLLSDAAIRLAEAQKTGDKGKS
tara:strand:+ start:171 stop:386 length:216 start_codon:yes stop_codon:yes gene_type:complete